MTVTTRTPNVTIHDVLDPNRSPNKWAMFLLFDARDIRGELLKRADPGGNVTPSGRVFSEETA